MRVAAVALGMWLAAWSTVAWATEETSQSAALKQFEDGARHLERGEPDKALSAFKGSLILLPSPNTRLYIARCYRALGKTASAAVNYRLSAREAADRVEAGEPRFAATKQAATDEAAELAEQVPKVILGVPDPAPPDLRISIDGASVPSAAWGTELELDPGQHVIEASAPRHDTQRLQLQIGEAEQKRIEIALIRRKSAVLVLELRTRPSGVSVLLDQRPLDATAVEHGLVVAVGAHALTVSAPGYAPFRWSGRLDDGETRRLSVALNVAQGARSGGTPPWALYSSLGLSAAAFGVGGYFALSAKKDADKERALDPLQRSEAARDEIDQGALLANVAFGVGALSLVGAGVLLLTTDFSDDEERRATVAPVVAPGMAALSARGRF